MQLFFSKCRIAFEGQIIHIYLNVCNLWLNIMCVDVCVGVCVDVCIVVCLAEELARDELTLANYY